MNDKQKAFPCAVAGDEKEGWAPEVIQEGMDLRDYFAEMSYNIADAMMKARAK